MLNKKLTYLMVKYIYCLYENKYNYTEIETNFLGYYYKFEDLLDKLQEFDYTNIPKKGVLTGCGYFYDKFEIMKNTKYFASIFNDVIILDIKSIIEIDNESLYHSLQMFGLKNLEIYNSFTLKLIDYNKLIEIDEKYYNIEKISLINKNELLVSYPQYKNFIEISSATFYLENSKPIFAIYLENTKSIFDTIPDNLIISIDEKYDIFKLLLKNDYEITCKNKKIQEEKISYDMNEQFKKELEEYIINITNYCNQFKSGLIEIDKLQYNSIIYKLRDTINFFEHIKFFSNKLNLKK